MFRQRDSLSLSLFPLSLYVEINPDSRRIRNAKKAARYDFITITCTVGVAKNADKAADAISRTDPGKIPTSRESLSIKSASYIVSDLRRGVSLEYRYGRSLLVFKRPRIRISAFLIRNLARPGIPGRRKGRERRENG